ncbi:hypothetical protein, partial [Epilithonimonas hominis]
MDDLALLVFLGLAFVSAKTKCAKCAVGFRVTHNGLRIGEGAEKESTNFQFCTNVSKTIFLFANLHFSKQIKNGFCGIEVQKLNLALNPLFCQYDVELNL